MKLNIFLFLVLVSIITSGYNWLKNDREFYEKFLTEEIEEIEKLYQDSCLKIEPIYDADSTKVEIIADRNVLKARIMDEIDKGISKRIVKSSGFPVGVFKNYTCGNYPELDVFMDCEDDYPNSSAHSWTGASYVTTEKKNVHLKFCIISDATVFERTNQDYAILDLWGVHIAENNYFYRWFDNQDDGNTNTTLLDGDPIYWLGPCEFTSNTRLDFIYYKKIEDFVPFPTLDLYHGYGVLGRFGPNQGYIYIDDEDNENGGNANEVIYSEWNSTIGYWIEMEGIYYIQDIMKFGENTWMFISEATGLCEN